MQELRSLSLWLRQRSRQRSRQRYSPFLTFAMITSIYWSRSLRLCSCQKPRACIISWRTLPNIPAHPLPIEIWCHKWRTIVKKWKVITSVRYHVRTFLCKNVTCNSGLLLESRIVELTLLRLTLLLFVHKRGADNSYADKRASTLQEPHDTSTDPLVATFLAVPLYKRKQSVCRSPQK